MYEQRGNGDHTAVKSSIPQQHCHRKGNNAATIVTRRPVPKLCVLTAPWKNMERALLAILLEMSK
jgi:hypothetical protein